MKVRKPRSTAIQIVSVSMAVGNGRQNLLPGQNVHAGVMMVGLDFDYNLIYGRPEWLARYSV